MHILPDLAAIEAKFEGRPFAVVGVHSAKFDNEKDTEAIRSAGAPRGASSADARRVGCPPDGVVTKPIVRKPERGRRGPCAAGGQLHNGQPADPRSCAQPSFNFHSIDHPTAHAVLRYEVTHPVVNDGGMTLWRDLGVSSWPTLAVVSPAGRVITMLAGAWQGRLVAGGWGDACDSGGTPLGAACSTRHGIRACDGTHTASPSSPHTPAIRALQVRATDRTLTTS